MSELLGAIIARMIYATVVFSASRVALVALGLPLGSLGLALICAAFTLTVLQLTPVTVRK